MRQRVLASAHVDMFQTNWGGFCWVWSWLFFWSGIDPHRKAAWVRTLQTGPGLMLAVLKLGPVALVADSARACEACKYEAHQHPGR